ncbi:MAG: response regulator [Myxococcales bacterium]|nr:response regulator [Myxococcales bacterium]
MSAEAPLVLVVEDEPNMQTLARIALVAHGYRTIEARTAAQGIRLAAKHRPDIVLLDLGLPGEDGSEVTRNIRTWSTMPILVISGRGSEAAKVKALDEGADDYMTTPFGAAEMMARIRVALRNASRSRPDGEGSGVIQVGEDVRVDLTRHAVTVRGRLVHLTPIEFKLLTTLVQSAGKVLTHEAPLEAVWGPGHEQEKSYLRVYMTRLRHKLERRPARPKHLVTEVGVGYRLRLAQVSRALTNALLDKTAAAVLLGGAGSAGSHHARPGRGRRRTPRPRRPPATNGSAFAALRGHVHDCVARTAVRACLRGCAAAFLPRADAASAPQREQVFALRCNR